MYIARWILQTYVLKTLFMQIDVHARGITSLSLVLRFE
jgi:hypothetical protein